MIRFIVLLFLFMVPKVYSDTVTIDEVYISTCMLAKTSSEEGIEYLSYMESIKKAKDKAERDAVIGNAMKIFEKKFIPCDFQRLRDKNVNIIVTLTELYTGMLTVRNAVNPSA